MAELDPSDSERAGLAQPSRWAAIESGGEFAATVVFAAGFALDDAHPVTERYEVTRRIGSGSMGQVLAVRVLGEQSQREYALKIVARRRDVAHATSVDVGSQRDAPHAAATLWLTKLLRDEGAKQEAAQRHGVSVARFIALVRLQDGSLGLRMEIARGRSWHSLIDDERRRRHAMPDIHRAALVTRKLLGQLQRLHAIREPEAPSGFVHSDIKPSNVFVDETDPTEVSVTLLDFGVATAGRSANMGDAAALGRETFVLGETGGTHIYAPPGHFAARPSPASDVHASIVCFYEMIVLALPWDVDDVARSRANLALIELRQSAEPRSVRARRPAISEAVAQELDAFFASALSELQAKSLAWSALLSAHADGTTADDPRIAALSDELSTLASDYRLALDALVVRLEALGVAPQTPGSRASSAGLASALVAPTVVATRSSPQRDTDLDAHETVVEGPKRSLARARSGDPTPAGDRAAGARRGPSRVAVASLAAIALTTIVGGSVAIRRRSDESASRRALADRASLRDSAEPGVALSNEPVVPIDVASLPETIRRELALSLRSTAARSRELGAGGRAEVLVPSAVVCVAPVLGVRVVAHSGALERDVTLCTTDTRSDGARVEFAGAGALEPIVLRALPTVQCVGDQRWVTRVRHFATDGGDAWLFSCELPEADRADSGAE
ncbi:MAG: hypothetical protein JNK05_28570 [Myxococcales bacterium]|nr:hypothetical protein [Myxococcales bacterium]